MYNVEPVSMGLTLAQTDYKAAQFWVLRDLADLAKLIKLDKPTLEKLTAKPRYHVFKIPKPGGSHRVIHNPHPGLKEAQKRLNLYLQAAYYTLLPPCAYGFIPKPTDEPHPRTIYTNALQHAGAAWVLNIDLKDFFHTVTSRHLTWMFRDLFEFPQTLTNALIALCTYKGVLPMGAPTSPVLSNLACLLLDADLQALATRIDACYTRFADDMTFSMETKPGLHFVEDIRKLVSEHQFTVNESKIKLTPREALPEVTGLVLKLPRPDVSKKFIKQLKKDIRLFKRLTARNMLRRAIFQPSVLYKLRRSIKGQLRFLSFVRGKKDKMYRKLKEEVG